MCISTFKSLLQSDLKIFSQNLKDKSIDLLIWVLSMVLVTYYIMPSFGLAHSYTLFMIASLAASAGTFEAWNSTVQLVSDFTGEQVIAYYLTLPLPSWLIFLRSIVINALSAGVLGILVLPICKLALWNQVDFTTLHVGKFMLIMFLINAFYGTLPILFASMIGSMQKIGSLWMRFMYPLWFFGCFQFSWYSLYKVSPVLAYANLLNPFTYLMEGIRNAVLGPQDSLHFGVCVGMLLVFSALSGWWGIVRIKRQLDCL